MTVSWNVPVNRNMGIVWWGKSPHNVKVVNMPFIWRNFKTVGSIITVENLCCMASLILIAQHLQILFGCCVVATVCSGIFWWCTYFKWGWKILWTHLGGNTTKDKIKGWETNIATVICYNGFYSTFSGLKIIFGLWPVMLTGQSNFSSVMSRLWPVKIFKRKFK